MTNEELIPQAKQGDKEALQTLYDNNIGIMHNLIFRYSVSKQDRDDFIQECYFALLNCVKAYDPSREILFVTYLGNAIVWMILGKKCQMKKFENDVSLNTKISDDVDSIELIDTLEDPESEEFVDNLELSYFQSEVQRVLFEVEQPAGDLIFQNLGKGRTIKYLSRKYSLTERDIHNHINRARIKLRRNPRLKAIAKDYGIITPVKFRFQRIEEFEARIPHKLKKFLEIEKSYMESQLQEYEKYIIQ